MRNITILFTIVLLLTSCGGFSDVGKALRNEKITNTDEFLVKKKEPLVIPPNYSELPKPGSIEKREQDEEAKIKILLKKDKNIETNRSEESSSTENTILEKLKSENR